MYYCLSTNSEGIKQSDKTQLYNYISKANSD